MGQVARPEIDVEERFARLDPGGVEGEPSDRPQSATASPAGAGLEQRVPDRLGRTTGHDDLDAGSAGLIATDEHHLDSGDGDPPCRPRFEIITGRFPRCRRHRREGAGAVHGEVVELGRPIDDLDLVADGEPFEPLRRGCGLVQIDVDHDVVAQGRDHDIRVDPSLAVEDERRRRSPVLQAFQFLGEHPVQE